MCFNIRALHRALFYCAQYQKSTKLHKAGINFNKRKKPENTVFSWLNVFKINLYKYVGIEVLFYEWKVSNTRHI